mgnify:CR=1 FL=1
MVSQKPAAAELDYNNRRCFGPDDSSAVANRPTRATRKTLDYSESSSTRRGDDDNSINGMSGSTRSTKSGKRDNPKILRRRYRDRGIKGSEVPPCKSDLSTSVVARLTDRKSWLAMVPEMMTVCNEAARPLHFAAHFVFVCEATRPLQ